MIARSLQADAISVPTAQSEQASAGRPGSRIDAGLEGLPVGTIDEIFGDQFDGIRLTPEISDGTLTLLAENL